jgi:hypothetical protein
LNKEALLISFVDHYLKVVCSPNSSITPDHSTWRGVTALSCGLESWERFLLLYLGLHSCSAGPVMAIQWVEWWLFSIAQIVKYLRGWNMKLALMWLVVCIYKHIKACLIFLKYILIWLLLSFYLRLEIFYLIRNRDRGDWEWTFGLTSMYLKELISACIHFLAFASTTSWVQLTCMTCFTTKVRP